MKISVIVPVYNDDSYLENCLNSIKNQTYKEIEVILIDDGSTDKSGKICDYFCEKDERFKVIHKNNSGVSDSRNLGIEIASGDYICFVDSDDWIENNYFESIIPILAQNKYSIIFNPPVAHKLNGQLSVYSTHRNFELSRNEAIISLFNCKLFSWNVYSTFFTKDLLKNIRFNTASSYGEDFEFKYKSIKIAKEPFFFSEISKYHYIVRKDCTAATYSIIKKADAVRILNDVMNKEPKHFSDILFYKQYIPRLLAYALIGISSQNYQERSMGQIFLNEATKYKWKILFSSKISLITKGKMLTLMLPNYWRKVFSIFYIWLIKKRL